MVSAASVTAVSSLGRPGLATRSPHPSRAPAPGAFLRSHACRDSPTPRRRIAIVRTPRSSRATSSTATVVRARSSWSGSCRWHGSSRADITARRSRSTTSLQVASLGLLKAIDRFDLDRGIAFSSYAVPTILGELKRHFRDRTWSVRVPRDLQELVLKVDGTVSDLGRELHRAPTVAEISSG